MNQYNPQYPQQPQQPMMQQPQQQYQQPVAQPPAAAQAAQKDYGSEVVVDGRIVWGDLNLKEKKNFHTKQTEIDTKTGKTVMEIAFGIAVPKVNPSMPEAMKANFDNVWKAIHTEGGKCGFQHPNPKFAWKFVDGDLPKDDGSAQPEHFKGCIVLTCVTRIPLNFFKRVVGQDGSVIHQQLTAGDFKTGDYVRVNINIKGHTGVNPGLYMNPNGVLFLAPGDAIASASASPSQMFGSTPFAIPENIMNNQQPQYAPQGQAPIGNFQQPQQPYGQPQYQQPQAPVMPNANVLPPQMQQHVQQPQYPQQPQQGYAQPMAPQQPHNPYGYQGQ